MWEKSKGTTKCEKRTITCDVGTAQCEDRTIKCEKKKSKKTTKCEKRTVTYNVGAIQCEDETVKYEKKIRLPSNVTKVQSEIMLVLHSVIMELSNVRKK